MRYSFRTNSDRRDKLISGLCNGLLFFTVALVIILYIILGITSKVNVSKSGMDRELVLVDDYECAEQEDKDAPIGVRKEYIFTLPDTVSGDIYLAFYTVHQYVEVFFGEQTVYSLNPSSDNKITKTVGSNWVMIPISAWDIDKEVHVFITPVYESFRNRQVDFILGSGLSIYKERLKKDLPQLILGGLALFVGLVFICMAEYNVIKKRRGHDIVALGVFSAMLGIWRLTDTRFTPFILPEYSVLMFYISVTMLMIGMVPFMKWMREYCSTKCRRLIDIYCVVVFIICLIQLSLQLGGILDLRQMLTLTHIIIACGVILAIAIGIYERVICLNKRKMLLGNKLSYLLVVGVIADVVAYYIKGNSSGLVFTLMAFILFIVFMGTATLYNYGEQEMQLAKQDRQLVEQERQLVRQERELAEKERHLTDSRIKSMMSQIRSHFIFNVLTTISTYCKIDPKTADAALIRFSRYLRKNINIIEEEGLIDFDMELEQVEDYIALEQLRFPQRITFKKEIGTSSFKLPPLTIQPLVENAIKHGLVENGDGGKITLRTVRNGEYIEIYIIDDGVGFDVEECSKKESVGIRNVRYRIENMVEGSLLIESCQGNGTTVTIRIPVKEY